MTRYIGRHGTARVAEVVPVGVVPPLVLRTEADPDGTPIEAFDPSAPAWPPTAHSSTRS
ncbi:MAG TPA: hypothetical protein VKP11_07295 [Frankiaceae bacterium]|nr:hypothetical protein [Frankiaceae bacterium]